MVRQTRKSLSVFRTGDRGSKRRCVEDKSALAEIQICYSLGPDLTFYAQLSMITDHCTEENQKALLHKEKVSAEITAMMEDQIIGTTCSGCHRLQSQQDPQEESQQDYCKNYKYPAAMASPRRHSRCSYDISKPKSLLIVLFIWAAAPSLAQATPLFRMNTESYTYTVAPPQNKSSARSRPSSETPMWHNPCGTTKDTFNILQSMLRGKPEPPSDGDMMHKIVNEARKALRHSRYFKEDYVKKTFSENRWWDHHERWKDMRYRWLPTWNEVPKHLHENALLSHLEELEMMSALQNVFAYLQKLAAGLELVVEDQIDNNGPFHREFFEAQYELKAVLCEIESTLIQKGVKEHELHEVSRDIIPDKVRNLSDSSYRNLRNWYIYRDYMNGLEYVRDAFKHLMRNNSPNDGTTRRRRRRRRRQIEEEKDLTQVVWM